MILEQLPDRASWLAARGIGGSTVSKILCGQAWQVWAEAQPGVVLREHAVRDPGDILEEGHAFEPYIRAEYTRHTGREVLGLENVIVRHPEFQWATASPDGLVSAEGSGRPGPEERPGGFEGKTWRLKHARWGASGSVIESYTTAAETIAPRQYLAQAYHYLEVTGLPYWDLVAWLPKPWGFPELRWIRVMSDPLHQRRQLARIAAWRFKHLVLGEMPPLDDSDECRSHVGSVRPADKEIRQATPDEGAMCAEIVFEKQQVALHEERKRLAEAKLGASMGATYGIRLGTEKDSPRMLWTTNRGRSTFNRDLISAVCPDAIVPGKEYRVFRPSGFGGDE